jgi:hypothetical protein
MDDGFERLATMELEDFAGLGIAFGVVLAAVLIWEFREDIGRVLGPMARWLLGLGRIIRADHRARKPYSVIYAAAAAGGVGARYDDDDDVADDTEENVEGPQEDAENDRWKGPEGAGRKDLEGVAHPVLPTLNATTAEAASVLRRVPHESRVIALALLTNPDGSWVYAPSRLAPLIGGNTQAAVNYVRQLRGELVPGVADGPTINGQPIQV